MPCTMPYFKAVAVAWDQLVNAHLGGWPDETLSSRAYRLRKNAQRGEKGAPLWPEKLINALFFWDRDKTTGQGHCELSFVTEREGRQLPPEARSS